MSLPPTPEKSLCIPYKWRLGFISTVNLHVCLADPGEIVVFFNEKCTLYQPPQIPCVFSGKMRLAFFVTVNSYDTRPTHSRSPYLFSTKTCVAETAPHSMCFFNESTSCVQCDCKFICYAVDRAHIPCLFPQKMRLAGILPHSWGSLSLCFLR